MIKMNSVLSLKQNSIVHLLPLVCASVDGKERKGKEIKGREKRGGDQFPEAASSSCDLHGEEP